MIANTVRSKKHGCASTIEHEEDVARGKFSLLHYQFRPIALPAPLLDLPDNPPSIAKGQQWAIKRGAWAPVDPEQFVKHLCDEEARRDHYDVLAGRRPDGALRTKSGWETRRRFGWKRVVGKDGVVTKVKQSIAIDQTWVASAPDYSDYMRWYANCGPTQQAWLLGFQERVAKALVTELEGDWGREILALSVHPNERVLHWHP
jgi:hypothetical protein